MSPSVESLLIDLDQLRRALPGHAGISTEGIDILGWWGMMVPAVTISPSLNLVRAKFLAAASFSNVCVKRGCRLFNSLPSDGTS
jgi:carbon monoxide dehydrogenase subunit G